MLSRIRSAFNFAVLSLCILPCEFLPSKELPEAGGNSDERGDKVGTGVE